MLVLAIAGCSRFYKTVILVEGPASSEAKLRLAKSIASESRLIHLRAQLKAQFPSLSASRLEGLSLTWSQTTFQSVTGQDSGTSVSVVVTMRIDGDFNPTPILDAARKIIEAEIARSSVQTPTITSRKEEGSLREPLS